jgi:hypothetical protein
VLGRIALLIGSIAVSLCLLELGARALRGPEWLLKAPNLVLEARTTSRLGGDGRAIHDPELGFTPQPGFRSEHLTYDEHGFRRTPAPAAVTLAEPPVLAVGDSFAHGDEVDDDATWPALLQSMTGRRVINAAMSGYGIDQIVLRAEQLVPKLRPAAIVMSFIADDLRRAEMKRVWGVEKPYFELKDDALVLRNVPVPPAPRPADTLSFWHWAVGWSVAFDTLLTIKGWNYEWVVDHERALARGDGERLACPLMNRLARLGVPTLVVAEYDFYTWMDSDFGTEQRRRSQAVLSCAGQAGLATLDTYEATQKAVASRGLRTIYSAWHPGPDGNRLTAEQIAGGLPRDYIPPR